MIHLTESIEIQRKTITEGAWGPQEAWSTHLTIKGRMRQLSGREMYTGNKDVPISTHRLYCLPADIKSKDRVLYNGAYYNVVRQPNDVMNFARFMQVDCELIEHG